MLSYLFLSLKEEMSLCGVHGLRNSYPLLRLGCLLRRRCLHLHPIRSWLWDKLMCPRMIKQGHSQRIHRPCWAMALQNQRSTHRQKV
jgi:hypothetical protein